MYYYRQILSLNTLVLDSKIYKVDAREDAEKMHLYKSFLMFVSFTCPKVTQSCLKFAESLHAVSELRSLLKACLQ